MMASKVTSMEIVPVKNQKVFLLSVKTSGNGNIDMRIKNSKGQLTFSDHQQSLASFVKEINISDFQNGVYTFELEDDFFLNISHFTLSNSGVVVLKEKAVKMCKPMFNWNASRKNFDVNWLLNEPGNVTIEISDNETNIIQQDEIKGQFVVARRYRLFRLPEGTYSVTVKSGERTYSKEITIF
jgi:archaellum component FlaF (FlaF/FlaG flagellin family)